MPPTVYAVAQSAEETQDTQCRLKSRRLTSLHDFGRSIHQLANTEEWQDGKMNGALGEVFIR
jgi:hypothetical protein